MAPVRAAQLKVINNTLTLPAMRLSTESLDNLLDALGELRQAMLPPAGDGIEPDQADDPLTISDPDAAVFREAGEKSPVRLALLHPGFGWLYFDFPPASAIELAKHVLRVTGADTGPGRLTPEPGEGLPN